ncbi:MAG: hypothetical protein WBK19_12820 [Azonexus sp.]
MELTGLGATYALLRAASDARSKASEERQAKRLGEMQDAIKRLQAMPTPKQMAKQDATNRVAMLKKRLEALKSMLLHASPEQARALARELKNIAKELSSVAKSLGSGAQGAVSAPAGGEVATGATDDSGSASAEVQAAASAAPDSAAAGDAASGASDTVQVEDTQGKTAADAATSSGVSPTDGRQTGQGEGDGDLRAMLQDAKKLLKEAIAMLKAKMALAANQARASKEEKQAKLDLQSAEKSLADIEKSLSQGGSELYSAQGDLGLGSAADGFAISGLNVNVAA